MPCYVFYRRGGDTNIKQIHYTALHFTLLFSLPYFETILYKLYFNFNFSLLWLFAAVPLLPVDTHALVTGGALFRLCGVIQVCEKALLVSQTLNCALALIAANLWPLLVINNAAADTYSRRAPFCRLGWTVANRGRKPEGNTVGTERRLNVSYTV